MLLSIFFTINAGGIVTYYDYSQWYLKKDSPHVDFNTRTQTDLTEHINGKNQKN